MLKSSVSEKNRRIIQVLLEKIFLDRFKESIADESKFLGISYCMDNGYRVFSLFQSV